MTIENLIEGLQILAKEGSKGHCICAEHDIIYAGPETEVSPEAASRLTLLGWHIDEDVERWAAYV